MPGNNTQQNGSNNQMGIDKTVYYPGQSIPSQQSSLNQNQPTSAVNTNSTVNQNNSNIRPNPATQDFAAPRPIPSPQPIPNNQNLNIHPVQGRGNQHIGYMNQTQSKPGFVTPTSLSPTPPRSNTPQPQQAQVKPINSQNFQQPQLHQSQSLPTAQSRNLPQNSSPRQQYINPSNIQSQIKAAPLKPESLNDIKQVAAQTQKPVKIDETKVDYLQLEKQSQVVQINTHDVLKLCIYLIPGIQVFIILFKSIHDEEVMWHARQSLVAHVIWLTILALLNILNLPLISGNGFTLATLWNIISVGLLIYAGALAYAGRKWRIPVISEIGIVFIDGKNNS